VLNRLEAIFGFGYELEVVMGVDDRPQRRTGERVVVGD
jgi:hypothetical protein